MGLQLNVSDALRRAYKAAGEIFATGFTDVVAQLDADEAFVEALEDKVTSGSALTSQEQQKLFDLIFNGEETTKETAREIALNYAQKNGDFCAAYGNKAFSVAVYGRYNEKARIDAVWFIKQLGEVSLATFPAREILLRLAHMTDDTKIRETVRLALFSRDSESNEMGRPYVLDDLEEPHVSNP